jgi:predicted Zn finger-like uncharacterized protein
MAKEVLCPTCGAPYPLAEEQRGQKVRCKKCGHAFAVGGERRRREGDEARSKKARGLPLMPVVVTCAALGMLVLGGGGVGLWYFWRSWGPAINQALQEPPAPVAEAKPPAPPLPRPGLPGGRFPRPGAPVAPPGLPITNVPQALEAVRDNDPERRWAGADWLSRAPRNEAQAAEVSQALDPLVRNAQPDVTGRDPTRQVALQALKVWGTPENVPTLLQFLQAGKADHGARVLIGEELKEAMTALARIDDERGADGILTWVGDFFLGGAAEASLRQMGPRGQKGLAKHYNASDDARRKLARRLLRELGTKPEVILAQVAADLKADDAGRRRLAAEALDGLPVVVAQREEVSRALNVALEDRDRGVAAAGIKAAKTWGTRENVPALIRHVDEGDRFDTQRPPAMEALATIKDERGVWPIARWLATPSTGRPRRRCCRSSARPPRKWGWNTSTTPMGRRACGPGRSWRWSAPGRTCPR